MSKTIIGVMAATPGGVIGKDQGLAWNYPDELEHFRRTVTDQVMVMGRKTFESTPPRLFKQTPIVFSKSKVIPSTIDCVIVSSIQEFLDYINKLECQKIFMIGGADVAKLFLKNNLLSEFILTKIHKNYAGDTYLDLSLLARWPQEVIVKTNNYTIYHLTNPKGGQNEVYREVTS